MRPICLKCAIERERKRQLKIEGTRWQNSIMRHTRKIESSCSSDRFSVNLEFTRRKWLQQFFPFLRLKQIKIGSWHNEREEKTTTIDMTALYQHESAYVRIPLSLMCLIRRARWKRTPKTHRTKTFFHATRHSDGALKVIAQFTLLQT